MPTVTGTVQVGKTLTAHAGKWKPAPVKLTYQWKRSGVAISGATKSTYKLAPADAGKKITVKVTGKKAGYKSAARTSKATAAVKLATFASASKPTVSGTATVHGTLTANPGTWNPTVTPKYQWLRNGVAVAGATAKTYALTFADEFAALAVRVTGARAGYATKAVTSASVTVTAPDQLLNGEVLGADKWLRSANGAYGLVMQADGNLVLSGPTGVVWVAAASAGGDHVVMQSDGNLVIYSAAGTARWGSGTDGYGAGVSLLVQDDGNLVLYSGATPIWTRAVVRWITVGANAKSGSTPGTQSQSGPTLNSTLFKVYPPNTRVPIVCGTTSGQGVKGAYSSAYDYTWHRLLGGDWVPDADFLTGTNGLVPGEPDCTPAGGGAGASKLDAYVAAHPAGTQVGTGQCVALIKDYLGSVWGTPPGAIGNAVDYQAGRTGGNFFASHGWVWHTDQSFQNGDVLVWSQTKLRDGSINTAGHVAIWYNGKRYDQNGAGGALKIGFGSFFNGNGNVYVGYWRHS
ncbi:hypothetical protein [Cellulomonas alba]|uniref:Bulb-type lectin domain-containing protein n=1 Tax=Cellulomonas alba TaxID=3053467 RepID=A0ABT7SC63_9CELL|nr:hypothetical protein [Cellulomonas alba]MDM7853726.1 hypothetical protein [Cellulomonas alba]